MAGNQSTFRTRSMSRPEPPAGPVTLNGITFDGTGPPDQGPGNVTLLARWTSAARRRAAYVWRRLATGNPHDAVPAAMAWLAHHGRRGGLSPAKGDDRPCPCLTGAGLETLASFGHLDLARSWSEWLLSVQLADGAFPDAGLRHASLINTARVLRAFEIWADDFRDCHRAARRAAEYLTARFDGQGRIARVDRAGGSFELWASPAVFMACVHPLMSAARRWGVPEWSAAARRAEAHCLRACDLTTWVGPWQTFMGIVEALVDLGHADLARQALRGPIAAQRRGGSVPAKPTAGWTSSAGLAQLAAVWYVLGERAPADRALACLRRRQLPSGGFVGSWGRGAGEYPRRESAWATRNFLEAARLQVEAAFETSEPALPETIDPIDGRFLTARSWLAAVGPNATVADVGCGSGRFLRQLAREFPDVRFIGVDPSRRLLAQLPATIERRSGGLLRIPAADGEFDGVLAVESLEHALLPEHAVRELCRVVRPGGQVLIIDKHRARQALSLHAPWERWFEPHEVAGWLSAACDHLSVEPVQHGSRPPSRPLFLAWSGTRATERT